MNRITVFISTCILISICFFQLSSAADLNQNPFTIDANTKKIFEKYVVQKGDTLSEIADKFNVSIQELSKYNNFKTQMIYIGQKLLIPLKSKKNKE